MDIKKLVDVFSGHEIEVEKDFQDRLETYIKDYPGEEIPPHLVENFNISAAFKVICEEIVLIKEKLGMK